MAAKAPAVAAAPEPAAPPKEPATEAQPHVYRVDLGESVPTPPLRTATDNES